MAEDGGSLLDPARLADLMDLISPAPEPAVDVPSLFSQSTEEDMERLERAVANGDADLMVRALHRIASTAASAGSEELTRVARTAHDACGGGDLMTSAQLEALRALRDRTHLALKHAFAR